MEERKRDGRRGKEGRVKWRGAEEKREENRCERSRGEERRKGGRRGQV